jgi:hypothetical protein
VTVPVDDVPPFTVAGFRVTPETVGDVTAKEVVATTPLVAPLIVTLVFALTAREVTVKVPLFDPAGMTTLAGTVAADVFEEVRVTVIDPPVPTMRFSVAVPVEVVPPTTEVGLSVTVEIVGQMTSKGCELVLDPNVAVIVRFTFDVWNVELTAKFAVVLPAGTVTVAGTVAAEVFDELRLTTAPPAGAAVSKVTEDSSPSPPLTVGAPSFSVTLLVAKRVNVAVELAPLRVVVMVDVV